MSEQHNLLTDEERRAIETDTTDAEAAPCILDLCAHIRNLLAENKELHAWCRRLESAITDALPYIPDHIPRTALSSALQEVRAALKEGEE